MKTTEKMTAEDLFELVPPHELKESVEFLLFQHLVNSPKELLGQQKVYEDIQFLLKFLSN